MAKILIVEDEPAMRGGLQDNLDFEGHAAETAADGEEGLAKIRQGGYDLIIMDVMMPKRSGMDVLKTIRREGNTTPVILLTAKGEEIDKVLGLELGADDYMTKPFSLRELLARVKALLRRAEEKPVFAGRHEETLIGRLAVNFAAYTAKEKGKDVPLSHKEFEVLKFLWARKNEVVSRDALLTSVWGYDESPTTRTIDNFILKLRQKIEKDANHPKIILTVHGVGYKLVI